MHDEGRMRDVLQSCVSVTRWHRPPFPNRPQLRLLVNISSIAGRFGYPGSSAYVSTKFAIEGLSESIAYELEPFGIKVVLVEPGVIRTNFFNSTVTARKSQNPISPYSQLLQNVVTNFERLMGDGSFPDVVAKVVLRAVTSTSTC